MKLSHSIQSTCAFYSHLRYHPLIRLLNNNNNNKVMLNNPNPNPNPNLTIITTNDGLYFVYQHLSFFTKNTSQVWAQQTHGL